MDLSTVDLLALQTAHMKQDPTTKALCAALTPQFLQLAEEVKLCLIYSRVDYLDESVLDELAWQMRIDWYDAAAALDIKRKLIKNSIKVHRYRGTPYAVEETVKDYFGDGYVEEWFEYNGEPYHFRVVTSNPAVTGELANQFEKAVKMVMRKSTILEQVIVDMTAEMDEYVGYVVHTGGFYIVEQGVA